MTLSEENLDKLKTFVKENNFVNKNNNSDKKPQEPYNSSHVDDPSKIFYSIIDNSDNINETTKENSVLKKSEDCFHNLNSRKTNYSDNFNLSIDSDYMYDSNSYP